MMQARNSGIDVAKGIGIILVVFGHGAIVSQNARLHNLIFSFHMPLFLFLSGVFLRQSDSFRHFLVSKTHSLLKPYFVVLAGLGLAKIGFGLVQSGRVPDSTLEYFYGVAYGVGATLHWTPLWFLPHLFVVSCFSLLYLKSVKSSLHRWLGVLVLLLLGANVLSLAGSNFKGLPWSIDILPVSSAFLLAGCLLAGRMQSAKVDPPYPALAFAAFVFLYVFFPSEIDLNRRVYGDWLLSTVQALLGIYVCLGLSRAIAGCRVLGDALAYIGRGALFVLIFHAFFLGKATASVLRLTDSVWLASLGGLFAGVAFPLALLEIVRRSRPLSFLLLPAKRVRSPAAEPAPAARRLPG